MSNQSKKRLNRPMSLQAAVWIANQALQRMVAAAHGNNRYTPKSVVRVVALGAMTGDVTAKLRAVAEDLNNQQLFAALAEADTLARLAEVVEAVGKLHEPRAKNPDLVAWKPAYKMPKVRRAFRELLRMARNASLKAERKPKGKTRTAQVALMS